MLIYNLYKFQKKSCFLMNKNIVRFFIRKVKSYKFKEFIDIFSIFIINLLFLIKFLCFMKFNYY